MTTTFDQNKTGIAQNTLGTNSKVRLRNSRIALPNRLNYRQLMPSAPTPTLTNAHTIVSPRAWPSASQEASGVVGGSFFNYTRAGGLAIFGTVTPNYDFIQFTNVNYGTSGQGQIANSSQASFFHDGQEIEFFFKGSGSHFIVKVDDQYLTATPQALAVDGNLWYYYINFGSRKFRRIDLQMGLTPFGGVYTGASDTIIPAPVRGPRCIVIGDSFTEAASGVSYRVGGWVDYFADAMGWDDVWKSGVGATGYLAAPGGKLKFRDRLSTDVTPFNPDVVMICGGINDTTQTAAAMQAEATLLYQTLQAAVPNVTLIATSPFWKTGSGGLTQTNILNARDGIKAAANAVGIPYIDMLEMPFPLNYTPKTATLQSNSSTTISVDKCMPVGTAWEFPNGDRMAVKSFTGAGPYTVTPDQAFLNPHFTGDVVTEVGTCFWSGNGHVGATTGWGNADLYVSSDGTHPSDTGAAALGQCVASLVVQALAPN